MPSKAAAFIEHNEARRNGKSLSGMGLTRERWCCAGRWLSRLDMNTCQTSITYQYIIIVLWYSPSSVPNILEITTVVPSELLKGAPVKLANTDLPNMYRRSTTETIMHPIGQNNLLQAGPGKNYLIW